MNQIPTSVESCPATFGQSLSRPELFVVRPDIEITDALEQVAINLANASILYGETLDADLPTCRAMNQVIAQLVEASGALVDASLAGLNAS